ncbi:MAG: type II secretion system F family protein [Actinobacteria bacterium]|nr:type II secretion system F family protein [Actinomycetota bacterium]
MSLVVLASLVTALAAMLVVRRVAPPPRRLHDRVYHYQEPTLAGLGLGRPAHSGVFRSVFGPLLQGTAERVGRLLDRSGQSVAAARLRQAGWLRGLSEHEMVVAYRLMQLKSLAAWIGGALLVGLVIDGSVLTRLLLIGLGVVTGATRTKARLEKAVETRRQQMRVEIYTVNQLLAMRVRAGGGVIQAVKAIVERGSGGVVSELEEALRLHRAGWQGPDAFRRIAEISPEPFCSRTYRLLAMAEEKGADLADALLALSEDVRETRRESVRRMATKRRAAMLVPTIALLAPVLILFVVAPLPYLITSWQ